MMAAVPDEGSQDPCLLLRHDESAISVTVTDDLCMALFISLLEQWGPNGGQGHFCSMTGSGHSGYNVRAGLCPEE